jgi:hypothetical protein
MINRLQQEARSAFGIVSAEAHKGSNWGGEIGKEGSEDRNHPVRARQAFEELKIGNDLSRT